MLLEQIRLNKRLIFHIASFIQLIWGVVLLVSVEPVETTGVSTIAAFLQSFKLAGLAFLFASICGYVSIFGHFKKNRTHFWLFLPQLFLLLVSALGAMVCIYEGRFADGTLRPIRFILNDQIWLIALAYGYTIALIKNYMIRSNYV